MLTPTCRRAAPAATPSAVPGHTTAVTAATVHLGTFCGSITQLFHHLQVSTTAVSMPFDQYNKTTWHRCYMHQQLQGGLKQSLQHCHFAGHAPLNYVLHKAQGTASIPAYASQPNHFTFRCCQWCISVKKWPSCQVFMQSRSWNEPLKSGPLNSSRQWQPLEAQHMRAALQDPMHAAMGPATP